MIQCNECVHVKMSGFRVYRVTHWATLHLPCWDVCLFLLFAAFWATLLNFVLFWEVEISRANGRSKWMGRWVGSGWMMMWNPQKINTKFQNRIEFKCSNYKFELMPCELSQFSHSTICIHWNDMYMRNLLNWNKIEKPKTYGES